MAACVMLRSGVMAVVSEGNIEEASAAAISEWREKSKNVMNVTFDSRKGGSSGEKKNMA